MTIVFHEMKQTVRSGCSRGSSWASNHPIIIMIVPLFIIMLFIVTIIRSEHIMDILILFLFCIIIVNHFCTYKYLNYDRYSNIIKLDFLSWITAQ